MQTARFSDNIKHSHGSIKLPDGNTLRARFYNKLLDLNNERFYYPGEKLRGTENDILVTIAGKYGHVEVFSSLKAAFSILAEQRYFWGQMRVNSLTVGLPAASDEKSPYHGKFGCHVVTMDGRRDEQEYRCECLMSGQEFSPWAQFKVKMGDQKFESALLYTAAEIIRAVECHVLMPRVPDVATLVAISEVAQSIRGTDAKLPKSKLAAIFGFVAKKTGAKMQVTDTSDPNAFKAAFSYDDSPQKSFVIQLNLIPESRYIVLAINGTEVSKAGFSFAGTTILEAAMAVLNEGFLPDLSYGTMGRQEFESGLKDVLRRIRANKELRFPFTSMDGNVMRHAQDEIAAGRMKVPSGIIFSLVNIDTPYCSHSFEEIFTALLQSSEKSKQAA